MDAHFKKQLFAAHQNAQTVPSPRAVSQWIDRLLGILFPERTEHKYLYEVDLDNDIEISRKELATLLNPIQHHIAQNPIQVADYFFSRVPDLYAALLKDAKAISAGDPAAISQTEVLRSYPGFLAIAIYRVAHEFHLLNIPLLPRILTEYAHQITGIDIHPGARIGNSFCIDHGTGLVIGGTSIIGDRVKLYQGVTLGALSVKKEMAATKRHPSIQDDVVIYAGATILGGETVIGHHSIIGGNVWLIKSVPPHSRIYYSGQTTQSNRIKN